MSTWRKSLVRRCWSCALVRLPPAAAAAADSSTERERRRGAGIRSTSTSSASSRHAQRRGRSARPGVDQVQGHAHGGRRRELRARRVHRPRRPHGGRDGRGPDKALAAVMGLKANVVNATFATIIPGLAAGRYDMGASSFTDTKAREKTVDFVDYANVGESFYTKTAGGASIGSIADICGKTVSVESGTTEESRRQDAEREVHEGRQAGRHRARVQHPDARPISRCPAAVPSSASPTRRSPTTRSSSPAGSSSSSVRAYAPAPYGLAMPKKRVRQGGAGGAPGADQERDVRSDLREVGSSGHRDPGLAGEDQRRDELDVRLRL